MITLDEIVIRLLLGALIGGVIGFEREIHGRAAGLRTQLIVCMAAVLIMVVSENYYHHIKNIDATLRIDPARISAGALIGIGFLGAGVIIKSGFAIRGLTTAASIWIVSAIGLAIGGGLYIEGILTSIITVLALVVLRVVEKRVQILQFRTITVAVNQHESGGDTENRLCDILFSNGFHVQSVDYKSDPSKDELIYRFHVSVKNKDAVPRIFHTLHALQFIKRLDITG